MKNTYTTNLDLRSLDFGLLIFRVAIAGLMLTHGFSKFTRFFGIEEITFGDPLGFGQTFTFTFAVFAEFFCSVLIIFGFLTRIAAIPLIITMGVAALVVHMPDGFGKQELPLLYMFGFILLLFSGPGKYSLDFFLGKRKK
ncbi:DoxX family protein [Gramella jeungdoensis]|uniref:DoxX family protein n=1 Tax=Gramella jeungdoensis TaxID=708091 RepID=A0ABT0Z333_9FLAO|nr:DoxX family protein [Gramella jeungdoensis]MCM8570146.1 DoxX family protein [Gramella jeungdoensis]